jgi:hypothetical protein
VQRCSVMCSYPTLAAPRQRYVSLGKVLYTLPTACTSDRLPFLRVVRVMVFPVLVAWGLVMTSGFAVPFHLLSIILEYST